MLWFFLNIALSLNQKMAQTIPVIGISSSSSPEEIRQAWGPGDAGSLLEVALTWSHLQMLDLGTQGWIPALWTLGMSALEVPLIWLQNLGIPIFFSLYIVGLGCWTVSVGTIWRYYSPKLGRVPIFAALFILPFSWDFQYMLRDYVFYSESIAYGLLFIGMINISLIFFFEQKNTKKNLIFSGILVGMSIMFRHTSDSSLTLLFFISVIGFLLLLSNSLREKFCSTHPKSEIKRRSLKINSNKIRVSTRMPSVQLLFFTMIALAVTFPWRIFRSILGGNLTYSLSSGSAYVPGALWSLPNSAKDNAWGWAGGNWACIMDLSLCSRVQSGIANLSNSEYYIQLAIKTGLSDPYLYLKIRATSFFDNWIPNFGLDFNAKNFVAGIFLIAPIIILLQIPMTLRTRNSIYILCIWGSFLLMHAVQLMIIHYESRYFIPVRILLLGMILNLSLLITSYSKKRTKIMAME
jgi:hypothetical protein